MTHVLAQYDPMLLIAAVGVALLGATVGVNTSQCLRTEAGRVHPGWLSLSALVLAGCAMWAANFTGLLAFQPGMPMTFDVGLTVLSFVAVLVFTTVALVLATRPGARLPGIALAAVTLTMGLTAMHYGSLAALRLPARIAHDSALVAASIGLAFVFALAALYLVNRTRGAKRYLAALPVALAVLGLHTSCIFGLSIEPGAGQVEYFEGALTTDMLAGWILGVTAGVAVFGLLLTAVGYLKREMSRVEASTGVQEGGA